MKKKKKKVNAAILIISNEILSVDRDQNVNFICKWLNSSVASLSKVRIIPDVEKDIIVVSKIYQIILIMFLLQEVLIPHDDITANSIAKAFKVKYGYHKEAFKILENYYGKKILTMEEKNGKDAEGSN